MVSTVRENIKEKSAYANKSTRYCKKLARKNEKKWSKMIEEIIECDLIGT